jgi:hypothetical protein
MQIGLAARTKTDFRGGFKQAEGYFLKLLDGYKRGLPAVSKVAKGAVDVARIGDNHIHDSRER